MFFKINKKKSENPCYKSIIPIALEKEKFAK